MSRPGHPKFGETPPIGRLPRLGGGRAITGALFLLLVAGHLILGGSATVLRIAWLLNRHGTLRSDERAWMIEDVSAHTAIALINATVPAQDRLIVYAGDQSTALEVAFYCFPRSVEFRASPETKFQLSRVAGRLWAVRVPGEGSP